MRGQAGTNASPYSHKAHTCLPEFIGRRAGDEVKKPRIKANVDEEHVCIDLPQEKGAPDCSLCIPTTSSLFTNRSIS
jgi:hypothetical protein